MVQDKANQIIPTNQFATIKWTITGEKVSDPKVLGEIRWMGLSNQETFSA